MLEQHFGLSRTDPVAAHSIYHDDAVLEFPQSGERFVGVANFREWRAAYPADVAFEITEVRGSGDIWVVELNARYDEGPLNFGVSVYELRDHRIARETIYVAEGWDPPAWRKRWRNVP
jgi:hypothetical protein